ncbi:MAG: hypothetical protein JWR89_741 [Tardiphaga sp.]|nr:hypothetical protein [Tardiphaga sp.]
MFVAGMRREKRSSKAKRRTASELSKLGRDRRRETAEETSRQPAVIVDHDAGHGAVQIWKHSNHIALAREFANERGMPAPRVVPAKAGTHTSDLSVETKAIGRVPPRNDRVYGSPLSRGRHPIGLRAITQRKKRGLRRALIANSVERRVISRQPRRRRQRPWPDARSSSRRCGPTCRAGCAGNTAWRDAPCRDAPP